ncbi:MAG: metallopeptidase [Phycisphaeraceae bacterium]
MSRPLAAVALMIAVVWIAPPTAGHSGHDRDDDRATHADAPAQQPVDVPRARRTSPGKGKPPHATAEAYRSDEVLGWSLKVHRDLVADEALHEEVRGEIYHQLYRITKVLPADKVELLKQVPIWVELRNPYSSACQYHPSREWLEGNGYIPEKAKCVEISSARGFLRASRGGQPYVMLHELAHAYHDQHLGFDHAGIAEAYKAARDSGSYDEVLHVGGRSVRAYAMTDHKEYFAEATEAYFGTNDHYPFVRAELKQHDPVMFEVVKAAWGKR